MHGREAGFFRGEEKPIINPPFPPRSEAMGAVESGVLPPAPTPHTGALYALRSLRSTLYRSLVGRARGRVAPMDAPVTLPIPSEADIVTIRLRSQRRRERRVPELVEKALVRLAATPNREWSRNELMKAFCDSNTRIEYGCEVWKRLLAIPGVVQGPEVVRGGRRLHLVHWDPDAT